MEGLDPVAREPQCRDGLRVAGLYRVLDLGRGHAQAAGVEIEPVEFARRLDQRRVPARDHVVDDRAGRALDIGRDFALCGKKFCESLVEIGAADVQANGHGGFLGLRFGPLLNGAGAWAVNPCGRGGFRLIPGWPDAAVTRNLDDSGLDASHRPGMTLRRPCPGATASASPSRDRRCRGRSARTPGIRRRAAAHRRG